MAFHNVRGYRTRDPHFRHGMMTVPMVTLGRGLIVLSRPAAASGVRTLTQSALTHSALTQSVLRSGVFRAGWTAAQQSHAIVLPCSPAFRGFTTAGPADPEKEKNNKEDAKGKDTKSDYMLFHPQYNLSSIEQVEPSHRPPADTRDWLAYITVSVTRKMFDLMTGYNPDKVLALDQWLQRFIFLETVAGVPGMVAAMLRHMMSLRRLERDHGWIHTLLEEAENERMHLLTFLKMKQPGIMFRFGVLAVQGLFFNAFFIGYIISPRTCHRFVGYLEEEAVRTYTHALNDIDTPNSETAVWASTIAPGVAIRYWKLAPDATVRDVIVAVRADEASHAHVNHTLGSMGHAQDNPFQTGHSELPKNFVDPPKGFAPKYDASAKRD